jgi:hypothetical protein
LAEVYMRPPYAAWAATSFVPSADEATAAHAEPGEP